MGGKEEITETIKDMIKKREIFYQKVKPLLTPIMLKSVKEAEKSERPKGYWELCDDLEEKFGLQDIDFFKRIIKELVAEGTIKESYHASTGGILTSK